MKTSQVFKLTKYKVTFQQDLVQNEVRNADVALINMQRSDYNTASLTPKCSLNETFKIK